MRFLTQRAALLALQRWRTQRGDCCFCGRVGGAVHAIVAGLGKGDHHGGLRCCADCLDRYVWQWEDEP